ncbi:MAG: D-tyrosyl-tRNA(Tyr) deacylase [Paraglaciecola sp.]
MIGLIQRVKHASVMINSTRVAEIAQGILLFIAVEKNDNEGKAQKLCEKVLNYRIFADDDGKMNLNLKQVGGELLVVSQFTLAAETKKGNRPGFSAAASPLLGRDMYDYFLNLAKQYEVPIKCGEYGADMQVSLVNNGPVTFLLKV